jgi:hypothetical protein
MADIGSPLRRAFAHNDFHQPRPLYDALEHGFTAIEADVFLVDGELRLAHGQRDLAGAPTLAQVYLDPLADLVARRGHVYPDRPMVLLVDVKSDAGPTYAAIHALLDGYEGLCTQFRHDGTLTGPVEVVVSGHTDLAQMEAQLVRYATADARVPHLEETLSPVVSMVSAKWTRHFTWLGDGPMHEREQAELKRLVTTIHETGCTARFWGTDERLWPELLAADVDLIIADDLAGLREFLLAEDR